MWNRHVISASVLWYTLTNWILNDISTLYSIVICFWFFDISTFYVKLQKMFVIEGRLQTTVLFLQWSLHTSDPQTRPRWKLRNNFEIWANKMLHVHHISFWDDDMHYFMLTTIWGKGILLLLLLIATLGDVRWHMARF